MATREHRGKLGLRCTICAETWPAHEDFATCPLCLEVTDACSGVQPMSYEDAYYLKNHADFERFYEQYDKTAPPLEERCPDLDLTKFSQPA